MVIDYIDDEINPLEDLMTQENDVPMMEELLTVEPFNLQTTPNSVVPVTADNVYTKTKYYKESPLGIAGGFHIVGFDRVLTNAHTNGNILTNSLYYMSNFGTNGVEEVSYIRNLENVVNGFKASQADVNSVLVVGTDIVITEVDNNNAWALNGGKVDSPQKSKHPDSLWQDTAIKFIDIDAVKTQAIAVSKKLQPYSTQNIEKHFEDPFNEYITILNTDGVSVYNYEFDLITTSTPINVRGFVKGSPATLVINVDAKGKTTFAIPGSVMYYTDGTAAPGGEVTTWQDANVIWNVYDSSKTNGVYTGTISNSKLVTGHILAPGATINMENNLNGTVIGGTVNVLGESHRTDFTGLTLDLDNFISISTKKIWLDSLDQDGLRPSSVTLMLLADGERCHSQTVTSDMNWVYEFTNLPKYKDEVEIVYTVDEYAIDNYEKSIDGYHVINTHTPQTVSRTVTKTWNDNDNQDGLRPTAITIQLLANGVVKKTQSITAADDWKYEFTDLPKYSSGNVANYTVSEQAVTGYTGVIDGFDIINTHTPETITVAGSKTWSDSNNQDGIRPTYIVVNLLADNEEVQSLTVTEAMGWEYRFTGLPKYKDGTLISYTVTEDANYGYDFSIDGYNITNTHTPAFISIIGQKNWNDEDDIDGLRPTSVTINVLADGVKYDSKVVTEATKWIYQFTDLPQYKNGTAIVYTVSEDAITGYTAQVVGYDIINTHEPETVKVEGQKVWDDNDDSEGFRPDTINVNLMKNAVLSETKAVTATTNWAFTFDNLPKYTDGTENVYTITEDAIDRYTTVIDGYTITNKHATENLTISGTKTWDDNDDQDGLRPDEIIIRVLADGTEATHATVTAAMGWAYTFTNLPRYKDGEEIVYTISEDAVTDYTTTIFGYNVLNTHSTETVDVPVNKVWNDENNQDGLRPTSITVNLLANDVKVDSKVITSDMGWSYLFENLPKKKDGTDIAYTITEEVIADYTTAIDNFNITNTHTPQTMSRIVKKTWDDNNNQDNVRPTSITVNLLADGNIVETITIDETMNWQHEFADLPKYKDGAVIDYTITEDDILDYTTTINGFDIVNKYVAETVDIEGIKTWSDANNQDGIRPSTIVVNLLADDVEVYSKVITEAMEWKYSFTNLPKYKDGVEVNYTLKEDPILGYVTEVTGHNITNYHTPQTVMFDFVKVWDDNNNQDGKRPLSIKINLFADGAYKTTVDVTAETDWKYNFSELPKYENGNVITYTITEDEVEDYQTITTNYDVTNIHTPETVTISGSKIWDDNDNQDGIRPDSVIVNLILNGTERSSRVVNEDTDWKFSFVKAPKYLKGALVTYGLTEDAIPGYTTTILGNDIKNTHTPETITIEGTKTWDDNDDQDGMRPETITVNLLADGAIYRTEEASEATTWKYEFDDVPKYKGGKLVTYTITEDDIPKYTVTIDDYDITNTHTPEVETVAGTKTWDDENDQDGKRPDSITIHLYNNGILQKTMIVTATDEWKYSFGDLPKYTAKKLNVYTIGEDAITDYVTTITGYDITNTHTPETLTIEGTKTWDDNDDQDGKRPVSIKINLLADGAVYKTLTVTATEKWSYEFKDVPKYIDGEEITYTITEDTVTDYVTTVTGYNVTNTHTPEVMTIDGAKTWDDNNNQEGKRPESITVNLLADGELYKTLTVTATDEWRYEFKDVPKYIDGEEITYTITEGEVPNYETTIDGYNITNSHTPGTVNVKGTKTWDDRRNQDGKRPNEITVNLYADGALYMTQVVTEDNEWAYTFTHLPEYIDGELITYTIGEEEIPDYETTIDGYDITNTHIPETVSVKGVKTWDDNDDQDGIRPEGITVNLNTNGEVYSTLIVTEVENWSYEFDNLPKYMDGVLVTYTITEDTITGYTTIIHGYDITNTHIPETVSVKGIKTWDDNDDQDGIRPEQITVILYADGAYDRSVIVTDETDWEFEFNHLPKYIDRQLITYTVGEEDIVGYSTTIDGYIITNTHIPEVMTITGTKTWDDHDNQDLIRPDSITVNLLVDGALFKSQTVTEASGWSYEFKDVPKYIDGQLINYTISEDPIVDYVTTITGYNITNTHTPETISVKGNKIWDDNLNQDGIRPASITVILYADEVYDKTQTITKDDNWSYEFDNLPKYSDGKLISYTIGEEEVLGYSTTIEGNNIVNIHVPETINVKGTKTWNDDDNQDGIRPDSITVILYANGETYETLSVNKEDGWIYEFKDVPKYDEGKLISYSIGEISIPGYTLTIAGYNITNTHTPETVSVSGTKTWSDSNNQDGLRPDSITVILYADGVYYKTITISEADNWGYVFNDLPKYIDGQLIVYTIGEEEVPNYVTTINGYNITNTHTPEKITIHGNKTWKDYDNRFCTRPCCLTVYLLANGVIVKTVRIGRNSNWAYEFKDLPKYINGQLIHYTISEEVVDGYKPTVIGYDLINTLQDRKINICGKVYWRDCNDRCDTRPEFVIVKLFADGTQVASQKVTRCTCWQYKFTDLPMFNDDVEIVYTIDEERVENYSCCIDDYDIVNTLTYNKISVSGYAIWKDNNNWDCTRPLSITIHLLANGVEVDSLQVTRCSRWCYEFKDLPEYNDLGKIIYTIIEDPIEGYSISVEGYNVCNTFVDEKINICGRAYWRDYNNRYNTRPESINVNLLANGEEVASQSTTCCACWRYSFKDLPKYKDDKEILYGIAEDSIEGYSYCVNCYNIYNTLIDE